MPVTVKKYQISQKAFDKMLAQMDASDKKVEIVPSKRDIEKTIEEKGMKDYIPCLIWMDNEAERTEENMEALNYVRYLVKNFIIIGPSADNS